MSGFGLLTGISINGCARTRWPISLARVRWLETPELEPVAYSPVKATTNRNAKPVTSGLQRPFGRRACP